MRVTKSYIKQLVKEELTKVLNESAPTDDAKKIMNYLKNVYVLPDDEEHFNDLSSHMGGFPPTFEELKAKIERETGEPYAKVLSFLKTMRADTYDRIDSEYLGTHDKYGEVDGTTKPYNWNKMGDKRDYGRKNRQRSARLARKRGVGAAIKQGTLKETKK